MVWEVWKPFWKQNQGINWNLPNTEQLGFMWIKDKVMPFECYEPYSCQCNLPSIILLNAWIDVNVPSLPAGWKGEAGLQPHHTERRTWSHAERRWAILLSVPRLRLMETKHSYLGFLTQAPSHCLNKCWTRCVTSYDTTRPQWIKTARLLWR